MKDVNGKPTSTGLAQSIAVKDELIKGSVDGKVCGCVFDTTASNTGRNQEACVRLQNVLGRQIFFYACRHHFM